jgi:3-methyladenine DNA glycosylase Tag
VADDRRLFEKICLEGFQSGLSWDWTFVGPTIVYSFMQAVGLVDDHLEGCAVRRRVERSRAGFRLPA